MNYTDRSQQERVIRRWVVFFIVALVLSGLTAFALETELDWLLADWPLDPTSSLHVWVQMVYEALKDTNMRYPFLAYGYDWLAFGHLVIALFFIGVYRNPVQNKWVRGIPVCWRLIDCSFGIIGIGPLLICYNKISRLQKVV